ncbi:hypothetical protein L486_07290 [Kwoniella mangroviensis CBS 10435]|uniref:Uncharacterized protein n=1 Tax=Kwoniella mangroviensis CBS 10435 TaxID=1331196 RepID=A0A1B9IIA1_9TREE|nr:hypothetical protein L486_07290 [Kwoniella mangroviensis CBS 10435]
MSNNGIIPIEKLSNMNPYQPRYINANSPLLDPSSPLYAGPSGWYPDESVFTSSSPRWSPNSPLTTPPSPRWAPSSPPAYSTSTLLNHENEWRPSPKEYSIIRKYNESSNKPMFKYYVPQSMHTKEFITLPPLRSMINHKYQYPAERIHKLQDRNKRLRKKLVESEDSYAFLLGEVMQLRKECKDMVKGKRNDDQVIKDMRYRLVELNVILARNGSKKRLKDVYEDEDEDGPKMVDREEVDRDRE